MFSFDYFFSFDHRAHGSGIISKFLFVPKYGGSMAEDFICYILLIIIFLHFLLLFFLLFNKLRKLYYPYIDSIWGIKRFIIRFIVFILTLSVITFYDLLYIHLVHLWNFDYFYGSSFGLLQIFFILIWYFFGGIFIIFFQAFYYLNLYLIYKILALNYFILSDIVIFYSIIILIILYKDYVVKWKLPFPSSIGVFLLYVLYIVFFTNLIFFLMLTIPKPYFPWGFIERAIAESFVIHFPYAWFDALKWVIFKFPQMILYIPKSKSLGFFMPVFLWSIVLAFLDFLLLLWTHTSLGKFIIYIYDFILGTFFSFVAFLDEHNLLRKILDINTYCAKFRFSDEFIYNIIYHYDNYIDEKYIWLTSIIVISYILFKGILFLIFWVMRKYTIRRFERLLAYQRINYTEAEFKIYRQRVLGDIKRTLERAEKETKENWKNKIKKIFKIEKIKNKIKKIFKK